MVFERNSIYGKYDHIQYILLDIKALGFRLQTIVSGVSSFDILGQEKAIILAGQMLSVYSDRTLWWAFNLSCLWVWHLASYLPCAPCILRGVRLWWCEWSRRRGRTNLRCGKLCSDTELVVSSSQLRHIPLWTHNMYHVFARYIAYFSTINVLL